MLIVHSAPGSPGASTTALYLAAQWAATGTEVLLVEADPGGGSLGHGLGIHFTPGLASFVASGLPVVAGNLIDHAQDVLLSNLHVMPSTSSPAGAREILRWLDARADALREVSASEVALIIDAGRLTPGAPGVNLRSVATGVSAVVRADMSASGAERVVKLLAEEVRGADVDRCLLTIGAPEFDAGKLCEPSDVRFCGSIAAFGDVKGDLAAFLNRKKRKAKTWRLSLEETARTMLPYTKAPPLGAEADLAAAPGAEADLEEVPAALPPVDAPGEEPLEPAPAAHLPRSSPDLPAAGAYEWPAAAHLPAQNPPPFDTPAPPQAPYYAAPSVGEAQPHEIAPPYYVPAAGTFGSPAGQPDYLPPAPAPPSEPPHTVPTQAAPPPPAPPPAPPLEPPPVSQQVAPPPIAAPPPPPPPPAAPPPAAPQPAPPAPPPAAPQPAPPAPPPAAPQPAPPAPPPAAPQPAPPLAPAALAPPPPPAPPEPQGRQPVAPPQYAAPPPPQAAPPSPPPHLATPQTPSPQPEPPPRAVEAEDDVAPSGSFRDWAARLHGSTPEGTVGRGGAL